MICICETVLVCVLIFVTLKMLQFFTMGPKCSTLKENEYGTVGIKIKKTATVWGVNK